MQFGRIFPHRPLAFLLAALLAVLALLGARTLQQEQLQSRHNLEKFHGLARLNTTATNIEIQIRESIKYSEFLAMLISRMPDSADPLRQKISLPHAEWELALLPRAGWSRTSVGIHELDPFHYLFSAVLALFAFISLQHHFAKAEQARRDPLTGVFNKRTARAELQRRLRRGQAFALIIIDVNSFKEINDQLGHYIGDQVLVAVARRIQDELRRGDLLARLGGDEFAILASGGPEAAELLCERIAVRTHELLELDEHQLEVGISCGFACCPQDGSSRIALYKVADERMYDYKRAHKNGKAQTRFQPAGERAERRVQTF